jgi:tight adherence protein C
MLSPLDGATPVNGADAYFTFHIGKLLLGPAEPSITLAALTIAMLSGFCLWRIGEREERQKRLTQLLGGKPLRPPDPERPPRPPWYQTLATEISSMKIIGAAKQQSLLAALVSAGMKGHGHLSALIAGKACSGAVLLPFGWLLLEWRGMFAGSPAVRLVILAAVFFGGWRLPEVVLSRLATRRRIRLEKGLPDALDLLVVCAEAGLSLDHAIEQVGSALSTSSSDIAREFTATAAEMRVLSRRGQALENLAERTGVASLRSIVVTLNQSLKFGTSLAESLRTLAVELRAESLARFEERAARLPVLLTLPLMTCVLPSLMVVIGTPLVLRIVDALGKGP